MEKIIPSRIKLARRLQRLSMDELVLRMGPRAVSKMSISKMERGLLRPSEATLQALAEACKVPISFFSQCTAQVGLLAFRYKKELPAKMIAHIEASVYNAIQHYFNTLSISVSKTRDFENPLKGLVLRNYTDAENAAITLRKKWEIGLQPIHSVYELLQDYGIHLFEFDMETEFIDGISTYVNNNIPVIVINCRANTTTERKRFTALHEACHLLCVLCPDDAERHQAYVTNLPALPYDVEIKQPDTERLCHRFAGAMLIPETCVLRRVDKSRTNILLDELISIRNLYGISIAAMVHRLHDLRIIDDATYHHFYEYKLPKNKMEDGWGVYPINETADAPSLLAARIRAELEVATEEEKI